MTFLQFLFFFLLMLVVVKAVQRRSYRRRSHSGHKDGEKEDFWSMDASSMGGMDMGCGSCGFDGLETTDDRLEKAKAGVRERVRKADARIETLETRIRKLERTVTDRSYRLSEEIENL